VLRADHKHPLPLPRNPLQRESKVLIYSWVSWELISVCLYFVQKYQGQGSPISWVSVCAVWNLPDVLTRQFSPLQVYATFLVWAASWRACSQRSSVKLRRSICPRFALVISLFSMIKRLWFFQDAMYEKKFLRDDSECLCFRVPYQDCAVITDRGVWVPFERFISCQWVLNLWTCWVTAVKIHRLFLVCTFCLSEEFVTDTMSSKLDGLEKASQFRWMFSKNKSKLGWFGYCPVPSWFKKISDSSWHRGFRAYPTALAEGKVRPLFQMPQTF